MYAVKCNIMSLMQELHSIFLLFEIKVKFVIRHFFPHLHSTYRTNIVLDRNRAGRLVCESVDYNVTMNVNGEVSGDLVGK